MGARTWSPDAPAIRGPEGMLWASGGDLEDAAEESVQRADGITRAQAAHRFARELGEEFREVRVVQRWVRPMSIAECWGWWFDHLRCCGAVDYDAPEPDVPQGWTPDGDCPVWEFCARDAPGAVRVWICRMVGERAPEGRA